MKPHLFSLVSFAALAALISPAPTALGATPIEANIFVNLAKQMVPSVVNISTLSIQKTPRRRGGQEELFRRFFEDYFRGIPGGPGGPMDNGEDAAPPRSGKGVSRPLALGTGFIVDKSGLILTNNHVVAGADEIKIHFTEDENEEPTDGKVVGRDPELDLALIKVTTKRDLVPVKLGDSDALQVGEYVMAVGNPFGQGHSVTHGIISAKGRKSPDFALANYIQTDAPINPGNSGGPLVNLQGEVIGINNAIDQRGQNIGFAIPINLVKQVLPQLRSKGSVSRGYIGVQVGELTPQIAQRLGVDEKTKAAFVAHVYPGSPAAKAGMKAYDVITEINGKKISRAGDLIVAVTGVPVGEVAKAKVLRGKKEMELALKIGNRPSTAPSMGEEAPPAKKPPAEAPASARSGLTVGDLTPEVMRELGISPKTQGVLVSELRYGSPADKAGLARGDVIVEVDRKAVKSASQFYSLIQQKKSYLLRVLRGGGPGQENFQVLVLDLK